MKIRVAQPGEPLDVTYVVCVPAGDATTPFSKTNVRGVCAICGRAVEHRPYVPAEVQKACVPCYLQFHDPQDTVMVEHRAIEELLTLLHRQH